VTNFFRARSIRTTYARFAIGSVARKVVIYRMRILRNAIVTVGVYRFLNRTQWTLLWKDAEDRWEKCRVGRRESFFLNDWKAKSLAFRV
jgi:hypothetical protein